MTGFLSLLFAFAGSTHSPSSDLRDLLNAIRHVETGTHQNPVEAVGDGGRSLGPYQISRAYWRDSGVPGRYEWVRNAAYAERVVLSYWRRHCPSALAKGDWQTLARVHNGGPDGRKTGRTFAYWRRVQEHLKR